MEINPPLLPPVSCEMVYLASHKPPQQPVLSLFSGTRGTPAAAVVVPFRVGLFSSFTLTLTFPRPCFAPSSPFETWLGGNCRLQGSVFPGGEMYVDRCLHMRQEMKYISISRKILLQMHEIDNRKLFA